jgi:cytidylate kinase
MEKKINIAIDGPAASGKSTTAKLLAKKLGFIYVDTGAMYRAATLAVLRNNIDPKDEPAVLNCLKDMDISLKLINGEQRTYLNGEDVSALLRSPEINRAISAIASYPRVRAMMVHQQQRLASDGGVIMDGRDIGTVVLPDAELKIFMIADLKERAKRRLKEMEKANENIRLQEVITDIKRRDELDAARSTGPLKKADNARELDTSALTIEHQVEHKAS